MYRLGRNRPQSGGSWRVLKKDTTYIHTKTVRHGKTGDIRGKGNMET